MNAVPINVPASAAVNGPSGPYRASASWATSVGDHLLEHAHVARVEVVLEEVARLLVALPERPLARVHPGLPFEAPAVLLLEDGEEEALLRPEVVVELAQRHAGGLGHLAGGETAVAVGEQAGARRLDDLGSGISVGRPHGAHPVTDGS
jgi:hypothetical protein